MSDPNNSKDIGRLEGMLEMLIERQRQTDETHRVMHQDTHSRIDRLAASLDTKVEGQHIRLSRVEHKLSEQRGVMAALAVLGGLAASWGTKVLDGLLK